MKKIIMTSTNFFNSQKKVSEIIKSNISITVTKYGVPIFSVVSCKKAASKTKTL